MGNYEFKESLFFIDWKSLMWFIDMNYGYNDYCCDVLVGS